DSLTQTEGRTSKFSPTARRTRSILQWNLQREPDGRTELVSMYHPTATRYSLFDGTPEGRKGQTLSTSLANRENSKEWFPSDRQTSYAYSDQRAARGSSAARWIAELSQALSSLPLSGASRGGKHWPGKSFAVTLAKGEH